MSNQQDIRDSLKCRCIVRHYVTPPEVRAGFRRLTRLLAEVAAGSSNQRVVNNVAFLRQQLYGTCPRRKLWYEPNSERAWSNYDGSITSDEDSKQFFGEIKNDRCVHCGDVWGDHSYKGSHCLDDEGESLSSRFETEDVVAWDEDWVALNVSLAALNRPEERADKNGMPESRIGDVPSFNPRLTIYCEGDSDE